MVLVGVTLGGGGGNSCSVDGGRRGLVKGLSRETWKVGVGDCPTENLVIVVLTAAVLWSGSWSHQLEFSHLLCKRNHIHMVV